MNLKIFSILLLLTAASGFGLKKKTKLSVKATKVESCESTDAIPVYVVIKEMADTNSYSGNVTLPYDITPDVTLNIEASKQRKDGTWEEGVINFKRNDPCNILNTILGEVWFKEQDRLKMPRGKCPIPKGTYHDNDFIIDLEDIEIPGFLAGKLKVKIQAIKDGKVDLCKLVDVTIF